MSFHKGVLVCIGSRARAVLKGWPLALLFFVGASSLDVGAQGNPVPNTKAAEQTQAGSTKGAAQVTKIDDAQFPALLKPKGKPLLINFWATWCGPCREEFPDLVKIDTEYKGKIDFITVTLDFEEELTSGVPKFLADMKATMPTYLLVTPDETAAIALVAKDWAGALPYTILYAPDGRAVFKHQGVVKANELRAAIDKLIPTDTDGVTQVFDLPLPQRTAFTSESGIIAATSDLAAGKPQIIRYGLVPAIVCGSIDTLKNKYSVSIGGFGCFVPKGYDDHARAYNRTVIAALTKRFGTEFASLAAFAQV